VISQEFEVPKITKVGGDYKQFYGKPIEYTFPDTVRSLIHRYIERDSTVNYLIEMTFEDNYYFLDILERAELSGDTISEFSCLLSSTNRYCKIGDKTLPIYFSHDKEFGFYGFFFTGTSLRIILRRVAYLQFELIDVYLTN
jgi:hypothetical protein